MVGEPQGCQLGGSENDEGLSQGAEGLSQHHYRVLDFKTLTRKRAEEPQHGSEHVQPGTQDQLWQSEDRRVKVYEKIPSYLGVK